MTKTHVGILTTKVWMIVPILLYVSRSEIDTSAHKPSGVVYALHITPWLAIGLATRPKKEAIDDGCPCKSCGSPYVCDC